MDSNKTRKRINSINDIFEQIASYTYKLCRKKDKTTTSIMTPRQVKTAIRLLLPDEILKSKDRCILNLNLVDFNVEIIIKL